jgi:hypothetical protein
MSLRGFHLLFIAASTVLSLGLAYYCLRLWREQGGLGALAAVVIALATAAGLIVYALWFRRKARTLVTAAVVWLLAADAAHACEACYGKAEGSMIDGARMGVFLLLAVTLCVQAGFVWFFLHLRRRARRAAEDSLNLEWADLQRGPLS